MKIYSKIYTEFLFFSLCWVVKKEKTALLVESSLFILSKNLKLGRIPKILQVEIQRKRKAQPTVLCRDLKLMSRHGILLMAHYQTRTLSFKLQPICLSTALISGHDIEVMTRHLLFSVPSVLMSRPQNDVATSLSSYSSSVCAATSFLGCDHLDVCMMTSCCDFDS